MVTLGQQMLSGSPEPQYTRFVSSEGCCEVTLQVLAVLQLAPTTYHQVEAIWGITPCGEGLVDRWEVFMRASISVRLWQPDVVAELCREELAFSN